MTVLNVSVLNVTAPALQTLPATQPLPGEGGKNTILLASGLLATDRHFLTCHLPYFLYSLLLANTAAFPSPEMLPLALSIGVSGFVPDPQPRLPTSRLLRW